MPVLITIPTDVSKFRGDIITAINKGLQEAEAGLISNTDLTAEDLALLGRAYLASPGSHTVLMPDEQAQRNEAYLDSDYILSPTPTESELETHEPYKTALRLARQAISDQYEALAVELT